MVWIHTSLGALQAHQVLGQPALAALPNGSLAPLYGCLSKRRRGFANPTKLPIVNRGNFVFGNVKMGNRTESLRLHDLYGVGSK